MLIKAKLRTFPTVQKFEQRLISFKFWLSRKSRSRNIFRFDIHGPSVKFGAVVLLNFTFLMVLHLNNSSDVALLDDNSVTLVFIGLASSHYILLKMALMEKQNRFFDVFRGYRKRPLPWNGLLIISKILSNSDKT